MVNRYREILCPTDFSGHGVAAARRAVELTRLFGARLTLLHVVADFPEVRSNEDIPPEDMDPAAYRREQALSRLADLAREVDCEEARQEVVFTPLSARHGIVRFAEEGGFDLIVMATHGRHGIGHIVGSTTSGVVQVAPCDVLAVRAREEGSG